MTEINELPAASALTADDLIEIENDPSGTPQSQKLTGALLAAFALGYVASQTEATAMDEATDFLAAIVGGNTRKVSPKTIFQTLNGLSLKPTLALGDQLVALNSADSNAAVKTTADGILVAARNAETTTYPADPLVQMIDDGNADAITMTPNDLLKGLILALSAFSDTIVGGSDLMLFYDQSASVFRSITPDKLAGGRHTVFIPAGATTSTTTNGAADGTTELATNDVMLKTKDFDTGTVEKVQVMFPLPKGYNGGTITVQGYWTAASGSGGVAIEVAARAFSNDDALDQAFGTAVVMTDTLIAANDLHVTAESSALTIAGTPADLDLICLQVSRAVANGSDTLGVDMKFLGLAVYFNTDARDDT